jgi:BirA family biotin operon repressor/biotin-[acetyl-CoA-carboxylase] ligase
MTAEELSSPLLTAELKTRFIGHKAIYFPRVISTMDIARREARHGAAEGTVIIAGEQAMGRGRLKRHWLSPPGNVALSVILYPHVSFLPCLIMIASLAVVYSIEAVTGLKARIKWPNDVLIGRKKVCGILIENELKGVTASAIIGIGINVNIVPSGLDAASVAATSLKDELNREVALADVVRQLLVEMERLYLTLPDCEYIYKSWRDKLATLGKKVTVVMGDRVLEGMAASVDEGGALWLRRDDGELTRIIAGDVNLREE